VKLGAGGFGIVGGESDANGAAGHVGRGEFEGDDHVVVAGVSSIQRPLLGVGLSRSVVKPSLST